MICMIDYGVGNLFNLQNAFAFLGFETIISSREEEVRRAEKLVLPGVGAFRAAAEKLESSGLGQLVKTQVADGKPLLGICLGMQLLFEESLEYGRTPGLGLIPGTVVPLEGCVETTGLKIPHMGWNALEMNREDPILRYTNQGDHVYFVHSYYATGCEPYTLAISHYGLPVTAVVRRGNVWGMQFHPEKSGKTGLALLQAFGEGETGCRT